MRGLIRSVKFQRSYYLPSLAVLLTFPASADDRAIVIVYKNEHRQSLSA